MRYQPQNTQASNSGINAIGTKCPECHGNGWVLYEVDGRALEDVYGAGAPSNTYAKPCPTCKGFKKESEDLTCVPDMYREADLSKFKFDIYSISISMIEKIIKSFVNEFNSKWKSQGMGLYLWSKTPGSGKTFLACCIGKSVMLKYNLRFKFITVIDYINKVSESYALRKSDSGAIDPSEIFRECELLVLDDIGAQMSKDWQNQEIYRLVDERMANGLITIFTSNMPIEKLNIDERAKSRIYKQAIPIQMPEESIREKEAQNRQAEFFKGIFKGDSK